MSLSREKIWKQSTKKPMSSSYNTWLELCQKQVMTGSIRYHICLALERLPQPWRYWCADITSSTESRWRLADIWGNYLRCCLLQIQSWRRYDYSSYQMWKFKIVDPIQYGWRAGDDDTTLYPTTPTAGVFAAPLTSLHLIKCGCSTSRPCSTGRGWCMSSPGWGRWCLKNWERSVYINVKLASNQEYACLLWK